MYDTDGHYFNAAAEFQLFNKFKELFYTAE